MKQPTIEELKELQDWAGFRDQHVVWLGPDTFVIAHTDYEREHLDDLRDCKLHQWLEDQDGPPHASGFYLSRPDDRSDEWQFLPWHGVRIR